MLAAPILVTAWSNDMNPNLVTHRHPDILGGTPVFTGTRVPVRSLFDYIEGGETLDEFLHQFPSVKREQAIAALELAERDEISVNQFIASAAAEKMASVLTLDYLKAEAAKGKRNDFKKFLKMVPDSPAPKGDGD
jgi:uncharacterized protein (DUF433 family)